MVISTSTEITAMWNHQPTCNV